MPGWLIPILNALGPIALKWALKWLETKYPGFSPIIKDILNYIESEPDKKEAVHKVNDVLHTTARLPDTVGI